MIDLVYQYFSLLWLSKEIPKLRLVFAASLFWRVPSKIFSTIYLKIAWNLSSCGKKNQNQNPSQEETPKPNQTKQKQTKTNEGDMDFVDGWCSGFPGRAKIILSKLKIRLICLISWRDRLSHTQYIFSLEKWDPKNESLEWKVGQVPRASGYV